jgi:UDP-glucose:(heptosyl)LPS alpha-1,3-glucosyltransferase
VVLEALASGLPVITTRYNGAGGIISQGREGFVLDDPRDIRALAESILSLSQSGVLNNASSAARRLAQRNSYDQCYEEMLSIFQKIGG